MFANKPTTTKKTVASMSLAQLLSIAFGLFAAGMVSAQTNLDDEEKLRQLERALHAPSESSQAVKPKSARRTRAIVFDGESEPQAAESGNVAPNHQQWQGGAAPSTSTSTVMDCATLPPGVRTIGVDFAIQFNIGSAVVSPASERTLDQIARILALSPDRCVIVEGHTDATGNYDKNMMLSRDRAGSVVNFISNRNGIDRKRLVPVGKGSSDSIQNLDPRDPRNRRVVFKVVTG